MKICTTPKQQERLARILKAAREAFSLNAFHEVLVEDVARGAGVGKGTIYRYFPDKESLYFAVIFDGIDKLKIHIRTALPTQADPEAIIKELIFTLVSFFSENQFFFRMMNIEDSKEGNRGTPNRTRWERERRQLIDAIVQMLLQAGDAGVIHARHPRTEAQLLMGMVRSALRHNVDKLTPDQMAAELTRIYLYGMRSDGREASVSPSATHSRKEPYVRSI